MATPPKPAPPKVVVVEHKVSTAPAPSVPAYALPKTTTTTAPKSSGGGGGGSKPIVTPTITPTTPTSGKAVAVQRADGKTVWVTPGSKDYDREILGGARDRPEAQAIRPGYSTVGGVTQKVDPNRYFRGGEGTSVTDPRTGITTYGGTAGHLIGDAPTSTRIQTWNASGQKISDTERVYVANAPRGVDPWMRPEEAYFRSDISADTKAEAVEKYNAMQSRNILTSFGGSELTEKQRRAEAQRTGKEYVPLTREEKIKAESIIQTKEENLPLMMGGSVSVVSPKQDVLKIAANIDKQTYLGQATMEGILGQSKAEFKTPVAQSFFGQSTAPKIKISISESAGGIAIAKLAEKAKEQMSVSTAKIAKSPTAIAIETAEMKFKDTPEYEKYRQEQYKLKVGMSPADKKIQETKTLLGDKGFEKFKQTQEYKDLQLQSYQQKLEAKTKTGMSLKDARDAIAKESQFVDIAKLKMLETSEYKAYEGIKYIDKYPSGVPGGFKVESIALGTGREKIPELKFDIPSPSMDVLSKMGTPTTSLLSSTTPIISTIDVSRKLTDKIVMPTLSVNNVKQKDDFSTLKTQIATNPKLFPDEVLLRKETIRLQNEAENKLNPMAEYLKSANNILNTKDTESALSKYDINKKQYEKDLEIQNSFVKNANEQQKIYEAARDKYQKTQSEKDYLVQMKEYDKLQSLKAVSDTYIKSFNLDTRKQELDITQQNLKKIYDDAVLTSEKLQKGSEIYKQSLEDVRYADKLNIFEDYYSREMENAKGLGKAGSWLKETFGVGLAKGLRNVLSVPVSGVREIKEDIGEKKYGELALGAVAPVTYLAKGIYDWDDPTNKDFKWHQNVNWGAVEGGANIALMGSGFLYSMGKATLAEPAKQVAKTTIGQMFKSGAKTAGKLALVESFAVVPAGFSGVKTYLETGDIKKAENVFLTQSAVGTGQLLFFGGSTKLASGAGSMVGQARLRTATEKAIDDILFKSKGKGYQLTGTAGEEGVPKIVSPISKEYGQITQQYGKVVQEIPGTKFSIEVRPGKARSFVQTQKDMPVSYMQTTQKYNVRYLDTATGKPISSWKSGEALSPRFMETRIGKPIVEGEWQSKTIGDTSEKVLLTKTDIIPSAQQTGGWQVFKTQTKKGIKYFMAPIKSTKTVTSVVETQRIANEPITAGIAQKGRFAEEQLIGKQIEISRAEYEAVKGGQSGLNLYNIMSPKTVERMVRTQQEVASGVRSTGTFLTTGTEKTAYISGKTISQKIPTTELPTPIGENIIKTKLQDFSESTKKLLFSDATKKGSLSIVPGGAKVGDKGFDFRGSLFDRTKDVSSAGTSQITKIPYLESPGIFDTSGTLKSSLKAGISTYGGSPALPGLMGIGGFSVFEENIVKERTEPFSGRYDMVSRADVLSRTALEPSTLPVYKPALISEPLIGPQEIIDSRFKDSAIVEPITIPETTTRTEYITITEPVVPPYTPPPYTPVNFGSFAGPSVAFAGFGMPFMGSLGQFGKRKKRIPYVKEWSIKNPLARPEEKFFAGLQMKPMFGTGATPFGVLPKTTTFGSSPLLTKKRSWL